MQLPLSRQGLLAYVQDGERHQNASDDGMAAKRDLAICPMLSNHLSATLAPRLDLRGQCPGPLSPVAWAEIMQGRQPSLSTVGPTHNRRPGRAIKSRAVGGASEVRWAR